MPLMEQELPILHLTSTPVVSCSIFSFLLSVLQINVCSFCPFSLGHFIVCPSSIYVFWSSGYPLWYLQIFLTRLSRVQLFMLYIKVKMIILFEFVRRIDICRVGRIGICRQDWHLSGGLTLLGGLAFVWRIDICQEDRHLSEGLPFVGRIAICWGGLAFVGRVAFVERIGICRENWHLSGGLAFVRED